MVQPVCLGLSAANSGDRAVAGMGSAEIEASEVGVLWCIENLDECGEGMFIVDAESLQDAMLAHDDKNPQAKITSIEQVEWIDLALVSGELGESYYLERNRKSLAGASGQR